LIAGASSYPRVIDFKRFGEIAKEVDAKLLVDMAHIAGLVATGLHPTPIGHAEWVTSTTHKTLRGPRGGIILGGKAALKPVHSQIFPGIQGGPLMHVIAAKAVAFGEALKPGFKVYQGRIVKNARALAECLMKEGMSVVSGGTDNHLVLVDLRTSKGCEQVTGKQAQEWLDACGMTCNKNAVPGELRKPQETSGIRLGTAALSTRGMSESDMAFIAASIVEVLRSKGDAVVTAHIQKKVEELASGFPIFKEDT
jgi:glycine hydroxymethyltransferase